MKRKNDLKRKILHITPHLGGGVGSVLLNYLSFASQDKNYIHSIVTLDYANENSQKKSKEIGFELFSDMHKDPQKLLKLIGKSDIVLIHFWNHPLLYDFLVRNELPANRVIFWSHISGFNPPYVFTQKVLNYPDKFIFTTPLSFNTDEVKKIKSKNKLGFIWSTGGVNHVKNIVPKPHKWFNVGYIGTVDYSKMHPDFLKICSKIDIPDVRFIVCGGAKHLELKKQAQKLEIADKFEFLGEVKDITKYLEIFDVFGYPLNPKHYGTCEQVLQEAMAAGVIPVVFDNPTENFMLKNGEYGIIANNPNDYANKIKKLYENSEFRKKLSKKIKDFAVSEYSFNKLYSDWNKVFTEVLNLPKTKKKWKVQNNNLTFFDVFLESLGDFSRLFKTKTAEDLKRIKNLGKEPEWQSVTKGTAHQYYDFFKSDVKLKQISDLMKGNNT